MHKFVDCFMLMGTALSLRQGQNLAEMPRPLLNSISSTRVNISLTIQELKISNLNKMEMELVGILNQNWIDPRLGANENTRKLAVNGKIWQPKITNINGLAILEGDKEDSMFWRGFGDEGKILLSKKIRILTTCSRNLKKFPFDSQRCQFKFGTYRFLNEEVSVYWDINSIELDQKSNLGEFEVKNLKVFEEYESRASGNFSVATVEIKISRLSLHYIICTMIPCTVLTLLNYVTFFFDLDKRNMRINLNTFNFGAFLAYLYNSSCMLQTAPYLKAIDVFVFFNVAFSILSILETALIDAFCFSEELDFALKKRACRKKYPKAVHWIDLFLKIAYPIFYTLFIILFSAIYMI